MNKSNLQAIHRHLIKALSEEVSWNDHVTECRNALFELANKDDPSTEEEYAMGRTFGNMVRSSDKKKAKLAHLIKEVKKSIDLYGQVETGHFHRQLEIEAEKEASKKKFNWKKIIGCLIFGVSANMFMNLVLNVTLLNNPVAFFGNLFVMLVLPVMMIRFGWM